MISLHFLNKDALKLFVNRLCGVVLQRYTQKMASGAIFMQVPLPALLKGLGFQVLSSMSCTADLVEPPQPTGRPHLPCQAATCAFLISLRLYPLAKLDIKAKVS